MVASDLSKTFDTVSHGIPSKKIETGPKSFDAKTRKVAGKFAHELKNVAA